MYAIVGEITKSLLFDKIPQEQLMEFYLGIPVKLNKKFISPLRYDKNPTCNYFYHRDGDLLFKDHSGAFVGNAVEVVRYKYGLNYPQALEKIASDFGLEAAGTKPVKIQPISSQGHVEKRRREISVKTRAWKSEDLAYWNLFGISPETLDYFNVLAVDTVWIDEFINYSYTPLSPAYAYMFGEKEYKVYFPYRLKTEVRFIGNSTRIQGYDQLPETGKLLIITKSLKDVMSLYELGVNACAYQAETVIPQPDDINELKIRFSNIYSLYDFDLTGIRTANKIRKLYNITPIFLTNGRFGTKNQEAKDSSEFINLHGMQRVKQFVDGLKTQHSLW